MKWEDAFRRTYGEQWHEQLFKDEWSGQAHEKHFVETTLARLNRKVVAKTTSFNIDELEEKIRAKNEAMQKLEEEVEPPLKSWQLARDEQTRIELTGDSKLIVSWINGHWPTKNRWYGDVIAGCIGRIEMLWKAGGRPRKDWACFARHVRRKFNKECDALAGEGKDMMAPSMQITVSDVSGKYWQGSWDGGHNPGTTTVGVGFKIWVTNDVMTFGGKTMPTGWQVKASGKGSVTGEGSTFAELMAFQSLLVAIVALREGKAIDIEECLGVPTAIRAVSASATISLERNLRTYLTRKREQEQEQWSGAKAQKVFEDSCDTWEEPETKRQKQTDPTIPEEKQ